VREGITLRVEDIVGQVSFTMQTTFLCHTPLGVHGLRFIFKGLGLEGGELALEGGGWRVEGGGWRVEG